MASATRASSAELPILGAGLALGLPGETVGKAQLGNYSLMIPNNFDYSGLIIHLLQ